MQTEKDFESKGSVVKRFDLFVWRSTLDASVICGDEDFIRESIMKLVDELFKKYKVIEETLLPYGFRKEEDSYFFIFGIFKDKSIHDKCAGYNLRKRLLMII